MQITNYEQCGTKYLLGFLKKVSGCRWDINYGQKSAKKEKSECVYGNKSSNFLHIREIT